MNEKICSKCKLVKSLDLFIKDNRRNDGRGSWCYECHKLAPSLLKKDRAQDNCLVCCESITNGRTDKLYCSDECGQKLRSHRYTLQKYGLSTEQYLVIFKEQNGVCAICGNQESMISRWVLPVDHCHETNKIRGLLCNYCNIGLGSFKDDPALLRKAADYLETAEIRVDEIPPDSRLVFSERIIIKSGCPKEDEHGPYDKTYSNGHRYCSKCKNEKRRQARNRLKNRVRG